MAISPLHSFRSNPFATCHVAPGRLPWVGEQAESISAFANRLRDLRYRAAITGPHGSGKSTLLAHLALELGAVRYMQSAQGKVTQDRKTGDLIWLQLRKSTHPKEQIAASRAHWKTNRILILDGFEQLSRMRQIWIVGNTWKNGMGLLVTSHRPVALLPTLYVTSVTIEKATSIVTALVSSSESASSADVPVEPEDLRRLLEKHGGNMREMLMELYDENEDRLRCE